MNIQVSPRTKKESTNSLSSKNKMYQSTRNSSFIHAKHATEKQQEFDISVLNIENTDFSLSIYQETHSRAIELRLQRNIDKLSFSLYCKEGQLLVTKSISGIFTCIPIHYFNNDIFLLIVTHNNKEIASYKIEKHLDQRKKQYS